MVSRPAGWGTVDYHTDKAGELLLIADTCESDEESALTLAAAQVHTGLALLASKRGVRTGEVRIHAEEAVTSALTAVTQELRSRPKHDR